MLVLSEQIFAEELSALVDSSMHTFVEEKAAPVHLVLHIDVAAGTAAAKRLEPALVPAAESHFAVACAVPKGGIPRGASDNVVVAVVETVVLDSTAGFAFD